MKRTTIVLVLLAAGTALFAQNYAGIPDRFFSYIEKGETDEAINFLYSTNDWVSAGSDQVVNLKAQLSQLKALAGDYRYRELLVEEKAGTRYAHLIYLVGYDRQPVRFELRFYKPGNQWRFQGVSFDTSITDEIEKLANQKLLGR